MFDGKYLEWNQKRIKAIIEHYGVNFMSGKKVLDLGCGHGDVGAAFYRLGAEVTAVDAREEHLKIVEKKHAGLKTVKLDLDNDWAFGNQKFDIIIDLGLLCHLRDYEKHLMSVCKATQHLILETSVCDSEDPYKVITFSENKGIYDWSLNGMGSRPSPAAIERILKNCGMDFKRVDNNKLNAGTFKYDWASKNNGEHSNEKRRMWFAWKNNAATLGIVRNATPKTQSITNTFYSLPIPPPPPPVLEQTSNGNVYHKNYMLVNSTKSNKLKVAVCISGFLRSYEQTFESLFVNLTDQFDCDFFIHTWDMLGSYERHFDYKVSGTNIKNLESRINSIYNPKQFIIETRKNFPISELTRQRAFGRDANGLLSMYYKILNATN